MKDGQEKYGNQNTRNKVIYRYESSHGKRGMKAMVDLKKASEVIQDVSNSIFGIFYTNEYGKYSYKICNINSSTIFILY